MSLSSPSPSETEVALSRGDDPASPRRPRIGGTGMQATPWLQALSTLARAGAEGSGRGARPRGRRALAPTGDPGGRSRSCSTAARCRTRGPRPSHARLTRAVADNDGVDISVVGLIMMVLISVLLILTMMAWILV